MALRAGPLSVAGRAAGVRDPLQALLTRIGVVCLLSTAAFAPVMIEQGQMARNGSATAFVLVAPVLVALIASGVHPPPGVADTESDWIAATLLAAGGFLTVGLMAHRLPTMAGLWHWDNYMLPLFATSCAIVVFSARHVLWQWRAVLFAFLCAPVMPYLLVTAALGGSEGDAVTAAAGLGGVAVYLATVAVRRRWRLLATTVDVGLAIALDRLLPTHSILARVLVVGGIIPMLVVIAYHKVAPSTPTETIPGEYPRLGPKSIATLAVASVALLGTSLPTRGPEAVPEVRADWATRLGFEPSQEFPFIRRFIGRDAQLTRYVLGPASANPTVAIDVISAQSLARLNDFDDAIWYPSAVPVNYRPADVPGPVPVAVRSAASDPDALTGDAAENWYLLTWLWRSGDSFQRITVVVSQDPVNGGVPAPRQLTWSNSLIKPMFWITRQQPTPAGVVSARVTRIAESVAQQLLRAGSDQ